MKPEPRIPPPHAEIRPGGEKAAAGECLWRSQAGHFVVKIALPIHYPHNVDSVQLSQTTGTKISVSATTGTKSIIPA